MHIILPFNVLRLHVSLDHITSTDISASFSYTNCPDLA
jgi:hypothetical protein